MQTNGSDKSLESWIWDAACSIRGAKDAPKFKDYTGVGEEYRSVADILDELDELESEAAETNSVLRTILNRIQV
jgi:type I restriction enzyme M protein